MNSIHQSLSNLEAIQAELEINEKLPLNINETIPIV